jgi:hypothetical protein
MPLLSDWQPGTASMFLPRKTNLLSLEAILKNPAAVGNGISCSAEVDRN